MNPDFDPHLASEALASEAESNLRSGETSAARVLYRQAAEMEAAAVRRTPEDLIRTKGILSVSTVSLFYKAEAFEVAEQAALEFISSDLPAFAREDLKQTLQVIWEAQALQTSQRRLGDEELQVAIRGSEIGVGRAPMGLVLDKVIGVRSLLYRITELLAGYPLRTKGAPPDEIRQICQPWVSEPQAGSYRFTIKLAEPLQLELIPSTRVRPADISQKLLTVVRAVSPTSSAFRQTSAIEETIPNADYRGAILKLVRNIVPDGHRVREIEFIGSGGMLDGEALLHSGARFRIEDSLRTESTTAGAEELKGTLRAVDLDRGWLEVVKEDSEKIRCRIGQQVLDDVVGPMLNRHVIAKGKWSKRLSRFSLSDIELDNDSLQSDITA